MAGKRAGKTRVTEADLAEFRRLEAEGKTGTQIARKLGWNRNTVWDYLAGRRVVRPPRAAEAAGSGCTACDAWEWLYQRGKSKQRRCTEHGG